jgi:hypothetical protein
MGAKSIHMLTAMAAMLGLSAASTYEIKAPPRSQFEPRLRDYQPRCIPARNQGPRLAGKIRNQICCCGSGLKRKKCPCGGIPKKHEAITEAPAKSGMQSPETQDATYSLPEADAA